MIAFNLSIFACLIAYDVLWFFEILLTFDGARSVAASWSSAAIALLASARRCVNSPTVWPCNEGEHELHNIAQQTQQKTQALAKKPLKMHGFHLQIRSQDFCPSRDLANTAGSWDGFFCCWSMRFWSSLVRDWLWPAHLVLRCHRFSQVFMSITIECLW